MRLTASGKPPCSPKVIRIYHIFEIGITTSGLLIPAKHGVDRLRQFCAALFIDAACIYPSIMQLILACKTTCLVDFAPAGVKISMAGK
jgi:hypothetical protein